MAGYLPLLGVLLFFTALHVRAAFDEYQVKAALISKFAQFVRWPAGVFADSSAPFTIGVLGEDPFGGALESVTRGETVGGRKFAIKRARNAGALKGCQIVFVSKSEGARTADILNALAGQRILTVGEGAGFCAQGGVFNFTSTGGSVNVEVSLEAAKREGLAIGSSLIKLCKIVSP